MESAEEYEKYVEKVMPYSIIDKFLHLSGLKFKDPVAIAMVDQIEKNIEEDDIYDEETLEEAMTNVKRILLD